MSIIACTDIHNITHSKQVSVSGSIKITEIDLALHFSGINYRAHINMVASTIINMVQMRCLRILASKYAEQ